MLNIKNLDEGLEVFKALGSEIRVKIIKLLIENKEMNMNDLASSLGITNGALTNHVKMLEESGIIRIQAERGGHRNQKLCSVAVDKVLVNIKSEEEDKDLNIYTAEVPIGHYVNYNVHPTCGIATDKEVIGKVDDPRYFAHPDRMNAGILWFTKGYVEYIIPNFLPKASKIKQITISMELSSEAPGINNDWPSDISFSLNDKQIGKWTSPGDFGDVRGIFTPEWWFPNWNQYGLLKMIVINKEGTFIDGMKVSDVRIEEFSLNYQSTIRFRCEVSDNAENVGGFTIFGKGFGNYNQDIKVRIGYHPVNQ